MRKIRIEGIWESSSGYSKSELVAPAIIGVDKVLKRLERLC
jgi:hypothetical protein